MNGRDLCRLIIRSLILPLTLSHCLKMFLVISSLRVVRGPVLVDNQLVRIQIIHSATFSFTLEHLGAVQPGQL